MMESAQSDISRDAGYDAEAAEPAKAKSPTELKHDVKHGQKEEEGWGKQFKPDAKIWELYLKDAEEEAKERAELWKTGLDSLLIFAGLFAGIVSAFVVDESNVPQQSSVGGASNLSPSAVSLWVEGLWLTSLLITLSCAVMGVLAKAWIAKFIPVSSKRGAKDAYDRCILDKRAKRWHLERVIMFIPLLLQIAAFLFTIGLAIRSFDANARIGKLAIVLVSIGVAGYLAITMIPVYYPTSPFQTPLSDLFILIKNVLKWEGGIFEAPNGWSENSIEGELADIWLRKLMKSSKASHVVEAIAELTRQWPSFEPEWRQYFGESASPMIISRRLQEYMRDGLHHKADKTEELCYHLEALLHLAHHFEELNNRLPKSPLFQGLVKTLSPAGPLRNWNVFQEEVRPLAYSLRTHVMIIARNSQSITCKSLSPAVTDIPPSELEDRPWEIMAHKVQPRHRLNFVIASCRGLVEGERNIQTVSSFVLSLSLAKAALAGTTNEWSGEVHKDKKKEAKSLAEKYLEILFDKIAQKWESMVVSEDTNITNTNANQEPQREINLSETINIVSSITPLLSHHDSVLRIHAIKIITMLNGDVLSQHLISRLSEMMLSDPDKGIKSTALNTLMIKLKKTDLNITIVEQIATALLLYGDNQFRIQVIPIIANLLNDRDATQHLIPNLTELMLRDPDKVVQITVLKALVNLKNMDLVNLMVGEHIARIFQHDLENMNVISLQQILDSLHNIEQYFSAIKASLPSSNFSADIEPLEAFIADSINLLATIVLVKENEELRNTGYELLKDLFKYGKLQSKIELAMTKSLATALGNLWAKSNEHLNILKNALRFLYEFEIFVSREQTNLETWINIFIIDRIFDHKSLSYYARGWLTDFLDIPKNDESSETPLIEDHSREEYHNCIKRLQELVNLGNEEEWRDKIQATISTRLIQELKCEHMPSRVVAIKLCVDSSWILTLFGMGITDIDLNVRIESMKQLKVLVRSQNDSNVLETLKSRILPELDKHLGKNVAKFGFFSRLSRPIAEIRANSLEFDLQIAWISFLGSLAEKIEFHEGINRLIDKFNNTSNSTIRVEVVNSLVPLNFNVIMAILLKDPQWFDSLTSQPAEKLIFEWLQNTDLSTQHLLAKTLKRFFTDCSSEKLHETVMPIPSNVTVLTDEINWDIRRECVGILAILVRKDVNVQSSITLIKNLASEETESDEDVRIEAIESLTSIIMADGEVTDVQILLQIIVKGAKEDTDDAVRLTAIKSLGSLITNLNDNILGDLSKMILSSVASTSVPIDSEWDICIEWVRSFNCLAKRKVYDTIPLIINIAKEYTDEDVRVHALECLTSLVTSDEELQETVKQMLSDITIIEDSSDEVQLEWIRLRVILGQQEVEASIKMVIFLARYAAGSTRTKAMTYLTSQIEDGYELQESVKNILSDAMEEFDDLKQFRTEWIQLLTLLAQQGVANSFTTILKVAKGDSYEAVRLMAVKSIISLIDNDEIRSEPSVKQALAEVDLPTNSNWETRKEWIKLFTILAQQNIQYSLTRIVKMAKNDRNEDVRLDAVQSLLNALKGNSEKIQEASKSIIPTATTEAPHLTESIDIRKKWLELFIILAQINLQNSLSLIIKMAKEDDEEEIRLEALNSLKTLLDGSADRSQEGFVEAISSVNMEFGLNCLNDPSKRVCLDWVKLMEHLLPVAELNIITKLSDVSAAHKDDDVQKSAIDAFSNQYQHGRLNPSNVLILSGEIESGLKHLHCEVRSRAIKAVQFVSKVDGTNKKKAEFRDTIISCVAPQILRISMNEEGDIQIEAENTLKLIGEFETDKISCCIVSALPSFLESIQNSKFTTRYARSCKWQYSNAEENNVVLSSVRRLVLVIRESRKTHVRTTASEVLTYIFTEYGETNSQIIDDTIPDIITIALDEKPPYPQVRDLALDLIIVIGNVGKKKYIEVIKQHLPQFMLLLDNETLRATAVRLISLIAQDANVRKAILLHIISLSTTHGTKSFKGYITLLSRLLLERRLKDESTDYVIMLLACTLVRQPRLTHLRFQVVSALWCNYREERGEMKRPIPGELVNWFTHALFGSHATPTEVHTWCKLGAKWLNNARVDMQVTLEEENRGCGGIGMRATSVTTNDDSAPEG